MRKVPGNHGGCYGYHLDMVPRCSTENWYLTALTASRYACTFKRENIVAENTDWLHLGIRVWNQILIQCLKCFLKAMYAWSLIL